MTTHCPLFVDRASIKSNILVHKNKATPAKDVRQIREILGVRAADNLQHAELILVVEGEEDRRALVALLKQHSKPLAAAVAQQSLGIESLQGGTNLSYKLSQIREAMCAAHAFLDHDECGLKSSQRAEREGLLLIADVTLTASNGMKESESRTCMTKQSIPPCSKIVMASLRFTRNSKAMQSGVTASQAYSRIRANHGQIRSRPK